MKVSHFSLASVARVLVVVQMLLSLPGPAMSVSAAPASQPGAAQALSHPEPARAPALATNPQVAPTPSNASQTIQRLFVSPLPTPTPTATATAPTTGTVALPPPTAEPTSTLPETQNVGPEGGALAFGNGRARLEFPAGAVRQPTKINYRARWIKPLASLQRRAVAVQFDLDAYPTGSSQRLDRFAQPLTLTVNLKGLIDWTQLPQGMRPYLAYSTSENPDQWIEVTPIYMDYEQGTLSARVDHFSGYQAGVTPGTEGVWSFVYNPPETSLFSGAASYQIPFEVPAGRNGLQPNLALSYNSRRLDGRSGSNLNDTDTGPVADGWSLDVMDISRERWWGCEWDNGTKSGKCFKDIFALLLNGTSYELDPAPGPTYGRYYAQDAPWLYIERRNGCLVPNTDTGACLTPNPNGGDSPNNQTGEYWIVRLPDGTEARLGYSSDAEQVVDQVCNPASGKCHWPNGGSADSIGYKGRNADLAARRWRVDTMTDTFGNTMTFHYTEIKRDGVDNEARSTLRDIYYNSGLTHIDFAGYDPLPNDPWPGIQPTIDSVVITNTDNSNAQVTVRQYVLTRTQSSIGIPGRCNSGTPTTMSYTKLSATQQVAGTGGASLPAQTFSYTLFPSEEDGACYPLPRLTHVDNGYGGTTDIAYQWDNNVVSWRNYRVQQLVSTGGVVSAGPAISSTYAYGLACYDRWIDDGNGHNTNPCASRQTILVGPDANNGPLVGHAVVTQTQWGASGEALARSVHNFHIDYNWRVGREWRVQQLDSSGVIMQRQDTTWNVSTVFSTTFTHADAVTTTDYSGGVTATRLVTYTYDSYGNQTVECDHGAVDPVTYQDTGTFLGDERSTYRDYYTNTTPTGWMVNKLARESVYQGLRPNDSNTTYLKSRTRYRYDFQCPFNLGIPPTQGALTAVDRWNGLTGYPDNCDSTPINPVFDTTRYHYDQWGNPVLVTDTLGHATRTQYDSQYYLYPVAITNTLSQATRYDYDRARGLLSSVTDPNAAITSYAYDAFGRLTKVMRPYDSETYPTVSYEYHDTEQPLRIMEVQREVSGCSGCTRPIISLYDGLGRLVQTRAETMNGAQQAVTNIVYDALGRKQYEYVPTFEGWSWTFSRPTGWDTRPRATTQYDALGRTVVMTATDGTTTRSIYVGWTTVVLDANGHQKDSTADAYGRLVKVTEYKYPDAYNTTYAYDTLGNLTRVTDALNNTTVIAYDVLGRKTAMSDPDMGYWSYGYDLAGNLTSQTDARGCIISFSYDEINRLTGKTYSGICSGTPAVSYGYDAYDGVSQFGRGRRTSMSDSTGSTSWTYDKRGRVTQESKTISGVGTFNTFYVYDAMDRVVTMTYPSGEAVTQTYNAAAQLKSVIGSQTYVQSTTYDDAGRVDLRTLGNNTLQTDYVYYPWTTPNGQGRLQQIKTGPPGNLTALQNLNYTYDAVGNVQRIQDSKAGETVDFTYDALDRLKTANGAYSENYDYNSIGNLMSKSSVGSYSYPASGPISVRPHAATVAGSNSYSYDTNGNMLTRNENGATYDQTWDAENRLVSVATRQTVTVDDFEYSDSPQNHGWSIYDGSGTLTTTESAGRPGRVMRATTGVGTNFGIVYPSPIGTSLQLYQRYLSVWIKDSNYFYFFVQVHATNGSDYYLRYEPSNGSPSSYNEYAFLPVGTQYADGTWRELRRDLDADLRSVFGVGVEYVKWFCIRGDYDLDSLTLFNTDQLTQFYYDGDGNRVKKVDSTGTTVYVGSHFEASLFTFSRCGDRFGSADFDGDGKTDLYCGYDYGDGKAAIFVWLSQGTSYSNAQLWWTGSSFTMSACGNRFGAADLNHDGKSDLYCGYAEWDGKSTLYVWLSQVSSFSAQTWWGPYSGFTMSACGNRFGAADLDSDGKSDDLYCGYAEWDGKSTLYVWLSQVSSFSNAQTWWGPYSGFTISACGNRFGAADLNHDGKSDLYCGYAEWDGKSTLYVWLSQVSSFSAQTWWGPYSGFTMSACGNRFGAADLDGDGKPDDLYCGYAEWDGKSTLYVWLSQVSSFSNVQSWWGPYSGFTISACGNRFGAADLNHDGKSDLYCGYAEWDGKSTLYVWLSQVSSFSAQTWWGPYSGFTMSACGNRFGAADLDGDPNHRADLYCGYAEGNGSSSLYTWLSQGSSFSSPQTWWTSNSAGSTPLPGATWRSYYYAGSARIAMRVQQAGAPDAVYYLLGDHLSSTSLTTDASGTKLGELRYRAFGETRYTWGSTPTDRRFTGQRSDAYINLYEMGARWYDADLGRWISPDSIVPDFANPQSLNRYSYVNNQPLNYIDRSGHCPWCLPVIALMVFLAMLPGDTGPYPPSPGNDVVGDIALRMASNEYDLARTGQSCLNGQCGLLDTLSVLPLIPGGLQSNLGKLDDLARLGSRADDFAKISRIKGADTLLAKLLHASSQVAKGAEFELEFALKHQDDIEEAGKILEVINGGSKEIDFVMKGNVFVNAKNYDWARYNKFTLGKATTDLVEEAKSFFKYNPSAMKYVFKGSVPDSVRQALEAAGIIVEVVQ